MTPPRRSIGRQWSYLRQLCFSGLDSRMMVPEILRTVNHIVPNDAGSFFWTTAQGIPTDIFHEHSPPEVQHLFLNHFEELFIGPTELNVHSLIHRGQKLGQLLAPPAFYFASNTHHLLVRGSGHEHTLDARIDAHGATVGELMLFRGPGRQFTQDDCDNLAKVVRYIEFAVANENTQPDTFRAVQDNATIVMDTDDRPLWMTDPARRLLQQALQAGNSWVDLPKSGLLPPFCRHVCPLLRGDHGIPEVTFSVPHGRLCARASWLTAAAADTPAGRPLIAIHLQLQVSHNLRLLQAVRDLPASPMQQQVAYTLATGASRQQARERLNLSESALKEHLGQLYQKLGIDSLAALQQLLTAAANGTG